MATLSKLSLIAWMVSVVLPCSEALAGRAKCSCDDLSTCTTVNKIPIAYAVRDVVRKTLREDGATPVVEDDARIMDEYDAPAAGAYRKVRAFYGDDRRLFELQFEFPNAMLGELLSEYADVGALAAQTISRGDFGEKSNSSKIWRMDDGTEISVFRRPDHDGAFLSFSATAVEAEFDAQNRPGARTRVAADEMMAGESPANNGPDGITTNTHQGILEFHADEAVLLGKNELKAEFCGGRDDFDFRTFRQYPLGADDQAIHVEFQDDDSVAVKLGVGDRGGNIYRFLDVRPGVSTRAAADGDCRRRTVSVAYTPTHSPSCISVNRTATPRAVAEELIKATGIRIDGVELLSEKTEFTAHFEISAKELLGVLRDVSDRELVEIDSMHYEFRVPVKGKRYGGDGRN